MSSRVVAAAAVAAALIGCNGAGYAVADATQEAVEGRIDGQWFTRDVYAHGDLVAIELVYCPTLPKNRTVCRTGTVWRSGENRYLNVAPR